MCSRTTAKHKSKDVAIYTVLRTVLVGKRMSRNNIFSFSLFFLFFCLSHHIALFPSLVLLDTGFFLELLSFFIIFPSSFCSFLCSSCFCICLVFPWFLFIAFLFLNFSPPLSLQWRQQLGSRASISLHSEHPLGMELTCFTPLQSIPHAAETN